MSYYRHSDLGIQSADSNFQYSELEKQRQQMAAEACGHSKCSQPQAVPEPRRMERSPMRRTAAAPSKEQLLNYINQVSLAVYDTILFLDTHPCDQEAMEYFRKHFKLREAATKEYARLYGPLTVDHMNDSSYDIWEWAMQPWPWEGGSC